MSDERKERRVAICGTAPTIKAVPWDDPTLEVWCLNDMSVLNLPRADRWYDLHPFDKMYFRPKDNRQLFAGDIPAGYFVRPHGHIDWLRKQTIPVYVQDAAQLGSPSARTFPRAEIEQRFGCQFASSPAWMIAHALYEGVTELHIYGIHLATEWEYQKQKPNMTFLLGIAAALGVKIVLPRGCPLLAETHQYAFEEDPDTPKVALKRKLLRINSEIEALHRREQGRKWYQRKDPNYRARLSLLQAQAADCQFGMQHVQASHPPVGY